MDFALTESQQMIRKEVAALARTFSMDYLSEHVLGLPKSY